MATIPSPRAPSPAVLTSLPSPSLASTTDTPTSSHRPSIDLNQPTATVNTHPQQSQRRNRAALRDYYNIKSKPAGPPASTSTPALTRTSSVTSNTSTSTAHTLPGPLTANLPPTLDDPTFDPESYIATLLRTSSLRDVLRTESQLVSEIRNLDGERKALVYDNYSKLIKAVSTIGEMQRGMAREGGERNAYGVLSGGGGGSKHEGVNALDGVRGLEGRLDGLMGMFEGERRDAEQDGEDTRKEQRDRRRKTERVRWVLEAEGRLQGLIAEGRRDEAKEEWMKVKETLGKWSGVGGVTAIREACERTIAEDEKVEGEGEGEEEEEDGDGDRDEDRKSDDGD